MPRKKRLSINFPTERAVLSDFLPYEVPITFSNRHFYTFLNKHNLIYENDCFSWNFSNDATDSLVLLLLGIRANSRIFKTVNNGITTSNVKPSYKEMHTIPFIFPIHHKINESRHLSLVHPKAQIIAVWFYRNYKDLITYYCSKSDFSLRSPIKVAACTYVDNKAIIEDFDQDNRGIETIGQNYENLRSFFVYEKYSNIYKFYESDDHHTCERNFNYLSKLDISKCFDSIYTHSISWAVLGKAYAKANLETTKETFSYVFDRIMQRLNYNETNGIVIGPELSRIFAEIILQETDKELKTTLEKLQFKQNIDYQIFRYVDDYFIFYNDKKVFVCIKQLLQEQLKHFKLSLNKAKEDIYERPIITPITIAKRKIATLLEDRLSYKEKTTEEKVTKRIYIHISSLTTDFKSILSTSDVTYSDILNYTLSIIERKTKDILNTYTEDTLTNTSVSEKQIVNAIIEIINFVFFIYAVAPKVNSTIRLCRIIQQILIFVKSNKLGKEYQHIIYRVIFDCTITIIESETVRKDNQIETLYLLVLLKELGTNYWLDSNTLSSYFNLHMDNSGQLLPKQNLHYFSISVLLYYMSSKARYANIRKGILQYIIRLYSERYHTLHKDSEMTHMTLDVISCPYIPIQIKKKVLSFYEIPTPHQKRIIKNCKYWFTKWDNFEFAKELDAKRSLEVY